MTAPDQITALKERIAKLKGSKTLSLLDEFLIRVWERNVRILENRYEKPTTT